jgi:hypothetical protein
MANEIDQAEKPVKKNKQNIKGSSQANRRQAGKTQQGQRRERRLEKLLRQAERKYHQLVTRGKSVLGISKHIDQLEYALNNGHKLGGKKSPLETQNFQPPHHRPEGFWRDHQRVWGSLAKALNEDNGAPVSNQRIRKHYEQLGAS